MKRGVFNWLYGSGLSLIVLLFLPGMQGCGFHLRGVAALPPSLTGIFIEQQQAPLITESLKRAFTEQKMPQIEDKSAAQVIVRVSQERYERRILSVNASGKVQEYKLDYAVNVQITDAKGQPLASPQTLSLERELRYDSAQVLAMTSEEQSLKSEMLADAARQIIRRLQFVKPAQQTGSSVDTKNAAQ